MKPVRVTRKAIADTLEIWVYLAGRNPRAADTWDRALTRQYDLLSRFPHAGAVDPAAGPNVRSVVVGDYRVFYRVADTEVVIVRILHGARDLEEELRRDRE